MCHRISGSFSLHLNDCYPLLNCFLSSCLQVLADIIHPIHSPWIPNQNMLIIFVNLQFRQQTICYSHCSPAFFCRYSRFLFQRLPKDKSKPTLWPRNKKCQVCSMSLGCLWISVTHLLSLTLESVLFSLPGDRLLLAGAHTLAETKLQSSF